ncbi:type II toxin-antitoxin system VapC family toxin [bacterium]|nr:type II toxin-antitoxin system VapC family toxin [bacterium]MBU1614840.1 type II toxin-antitoxin system VapC family toxin [bacterium]
MKKCLLDTDILSYYFKEIESVIEKGNEYLDTYGYFTISSITGFEIFAGYKKVRNKKKEELFIEFCEENEILPLDYQEVKGASEIYDKLNRLGTPLEIPDIFIASTAIVNDLVLVTNNVAHFNRIEELKVENWL